MRIQANMDATEAAVLAERATFLLAEKIGKEKAHALVEAALAKGGSFIDALGQLKERTVRREGAAGLFAPIRRPIAGRPQT